MYSSSVIISIKADVSKSLKAGTKIPIAPNAANYFVGLNGTGKSVTFSTLAAKVQNSLKVKGNWMTPPPSYLMDKIEISGFDGIKDVYHFTAKSRQSQWIDLDMAFSSASGIGSLKSSEGVNNQAELVSVFEKAKKDPALDESTLYIFDEIDGCLDVRAKSIFFDRLIPALKGTVIICSHDCLFLKARSLFDFTDCKVKTTQKFLMENSLSNI